MSLQEHLIQMGDEINKQLEDIMNNEEEYKKLEKMNTCEEYFDKWLQEYEISNPTGEYFLDPENEDSSLVCNI